MHPDPSGVKGLFINLTNLAMVAVDIEYVVCWCTAQIEKASCSENILCASNFIKE